MFGGGASLNPKSESAIEDINNVTTKANNDGGNGGNGGNGSNGNGNGNSGGGGGDTSSSSSRKKDDKSSSAEPNAEKTSAPAAIPTPNVTAGNEKRGSNNSPPASGGSVEQKKRRSSGVSSRASSLLASAKNTLNFSQVGRMNSDAASSSNQTPLQKLGKQDAALVVPQGQHNNSAGESVPGPRSTFRVGVWEDRNKKCRRTMEDTHAFLYNFLRTPAPALGVPDGGSTRSAKSADTASEAVSGSGSSSLVDDMLETDNGYFAIFDGHAGTFAADWCGKKLHLILEDIIRKNPNAPIPELLDQTFTSVDAQLEKLPLKNSGCTAAVAVLRWEDRVPSNQSATGSQGIATALVAKANNEEPTSTDDKAGTATAADTTTSTTATADASHLPADTEAARVKLKSSASRQRVLYTANVGDARIILCRSGKAIRLSYDHKGSDDNEGRRIANAGGLILNNRVNGVLAVTRALGDMYIKDLVTGHPYTTETVIQPEVDEFIIIACDGLWDVCTDQDAVNLVRSTQDPITAAKMLVDHALAHFSTDNLSCMIIRFDKDALVETPQNKDGLIGVEGDEEGSEAKPSEAEKIVSNVKQKIAEGGTPPVGVSASNSGRGHDSAAVKEDTFKRTTIEGSVEEEPSSTGEEGAKRTTDGLTTSADTEVPIGSKS